MAPLQDQQLVTGLEGVSSKIQISDDSDFGTGSFSTWFNRGRLPPQETISVLIGRPPDFKILVTIRPSRFVSAVLGHGDGSRPVDNATFLLPADVDSHTGHTLNVEFAHWHIFGASLDGVPLARQDSSRTYRSPRNDAVIDEPACS